MVDWTGEVGYRISKYFILLTLLLFPNNRDAIENRV